MLPFLNQPLTGSYILIRINIRIILFLVGLTPLSLWADEPIEAKVAERALKIVPDESIVSLRLRIPETVIAELVNHDYHRNSPVDRTVMGTRSRGTASCTGTVSADLVENQNGAEFICCISGTVVSHTCGTNGPAIVQSKSTTNYTAYKPVFFDGKSFRTRPTTIKSNTNIAISGIGSSSPGIRGRIVKRIASRRASQSLPQAEAITAKLTSADLQREIDNEFEDRVAKMNQQLAGRLEILKYLAIAKRDLKIRSFDRFIEVSFSGADEAYTMLPDIDPNGNENPSIELWIDFKNRDLPNLRLSNLVSQIPKWLHTYIQKESNVSELTDQRLEIARRDKWLVFQLKGKQPDAGTPFTTVE